MMELSFQYENSEDTIRLVCLMHCSICQFLVLYRYSLSWWASCSKAISIFVNWMVFRRLPRAVWCTLPMSLQTRFRYFTKAIYLTIKEYDRDFQIYIGLSNKKFGKALSNHYAGLCALPRENTHFMVSFYQDLRVGNLDQCMERIKSFFRLYPQWYE